MWGEFRERLQEAWGEPWQPLGLPAAGTLLGLFAVVVLVEARSAERWVPLLDEVNLIFHESGHPIFGLLGWETLAILGGTLMQLLVPLLVAGSFVLKRQPAGFAFGLFWAAQNLLNIARYMADARVQELPLVGNGDHDWTEIFGRWGVLHLDGRIAGMVRGAGVVLMIGAVIWLYRRWRADRE